MEVKGHSSWGGLKRFSQLLSVQRMFVFNLAQSIRSDTSFVMLTQQEQEFYSRMNAPLLDSNIVHKNNHFTVYLNKDCCELIVKGSDQCFITPQEMLESISRLTSGTPMFPTIIMGKGHTETDTTLNTMITPLFGQTQKVVKVWSASRIIEGNVLYTVKSIDSDNADLCVVLLAQNINITLDGRVMSEFYYHFRCVDFLKMTEKERNTTISVFIVAVIIERIVIQNNITFTGWRSCGNYNELVQEMFLYSVLLNSKTKNCRINTIVPLIPRYSNPSIFKFLKCPINSLQKVMTMLSINDLFNVMKTCKTLRGLVLGYDAVWKVMYDLHFNPATFQIFNTRHTRVQENKTDAFPTFQKSLIVFQKWKKNLPTKRKLFKLFENHSVDLIVKLESSDFVFASKDGVFKFFDSKSRCTKTRILKEKINKFQYNYASNDILLALENDNIVLYDTTKEVIKKCPENNIKMFSFLQDNSRMLCYDNKTVFVKNIYDGEVVWSQTTNNSFVDGRQVEPNFFLIHNRDSFCGFDIRQSGQCMKIEFQNSVIDCFDGYDNSIVVGFDSGNVLLYDYRQMAVLQKRRVAVTPVQLIKVYNRKMCVGNKSGTLFYLHCENKWFGECKILYTHKSPVTVVEMSDTLLASGSASGEFMYSNYGIN
ncbi:hypothetical protein EIN_251510 [Entamoeba invadens IP1]|uniref:F-box domain-containing protein n=1 Tax=Entamoeba invadens IP1 TaxID=370355 RepID=A0A0A1UHA6_ENTIV|nr:hypothetical protein EIN_251510 [Entamoeba invadens IP1]ELP94987.1 hypothetical protein EIN_251510 [Entamoeba invadens IP1]|eukprot:XP_004261758.1 hypothetical protein EIN_251510 [Entamoeba invadens IP1]